MPGKVIIKVVSREAGFEYGSIVGNNQHSCKLFKNYLMSFFRHFKLPHSRADWGGGDTAQGGLHPDYFLQTNS